MRAKFLILITAAAVHLGALAQADWSAERRANLERLKADPSADGINKSLAALPPHEAGRAAGDFTDHLRKQGQITTLEHARMNLEIVRTYLPSNDDDAMAAREYWGYRVMVAAKLQAGEIRQEEYEYLVDKKTDEARRGITNREAQAGAIVQQRDAAAARQQDLAIGNMLLSIGAGMQPKPTVNCSSMRVGAAVSTTCR